MMLVELTPIESADLPISSFRDHLRLGSGFSDDSVQDPVLESYLRAAIAAIEARTGKVLLEREFAWTLVQWRDNQKQPLPLAPVKSVVDVVTIDTLGMEESATPNWALIQDSHRPILSSISGSLPTVPADGSVRVELTAGFGVWSDVPADLVVAVYLLAAHYYEFRYEGAAANTTMPFGVADLIEKYRIIRTFAGSQS